MELLSLMLHAAVRGLNSLADLEVLLSFNEKYFGNTVDNRNPTLLEVLRFEEEVLREKIMWREKYENVIAGWIESKSAVRGQKKAHKTASEQGEPVSIDAAAESKSDDAGKTDGTGRNTSANTTADAAKPETAENGAASAVTEASAPHEPTVAKDDKPDAANVADGHENGERKTVTERDTDEKSADGATAAATAAAAAAVVENRESAESQTPKTE